MFKIWRNKYHLTIILSILILMIGMITHAQRFAVIGDYGSGDVNERNVAELVRSWKPDFIITTGDNNYREGSFASMDSCIGQFYSEYIHPYFGSFPQGDLSYNRFFPSLGNHDVTPGNMQTFYDYFTLPGNERYYDFVFGKIHFFTLNSNPAEPDGTDAHSAQAGWLRRNLKMSTSRWNIVFFHYPPYSSGYHGSNPYMQWPFDSWGIHAVLSGHDHNFERLQAGSLAYFVNGSGGAYLRSFADTLAESKVRYCDDFGAQLVDTYQDSMVFSYININDSLIDRYTLLYNPTLLTTDDAISLQEEVLIYPNPFNQSTTIHLSLHQTSDIQIRAYNTLGELVEIVTDCRCDPGSCSIEWENNHLKPGLYQLFISCKSFTGNCRVLKIK